MRAPLAPDSRARVHLCAPSLASARLDAAASLDAAAVPDPLTSDSRLRPETHACVRHSGHGRWIPAHFLFPTHTSGMTILLAQDTHVMCSRDSAHRRPSPAPNSVAQTQQVSSSVDCIRARSSPPLSLSQQTKSRGDQWPRPRRRRRCRGSVSPPFSDSGTHRFISTAPHAGCLAQVWPLGDSSVITTTAHRKPQRRMYAFWRAP